MILYFTGTGNSYQLAKTIEQATGDKLVSINQRLREHSTAPLSSETPFVIVAPIYCGRIPRVVEEHIRSTEFTGSKEVYFATTCSETPYKAESYIKHLCAEKGWKLAGFSAVKMPQNYIAMYTLPAPDAAREIIEAAEPKMLAIAKAIRDREPLSGTPKGSAAMSDIVNPIFYRMVINARGFSVASSCIGCGTCAKVCPLGNIHLDGGTPAWGASCTHCMACINACPKLAIEFKDKTRGRSRYWNPSYPKDGE